ncbi:MAG: hypothetical protein EOP08_05295 [Proteobacteria bacterium]|nr:MAG: hypothetical protein EOP08_05295 [Pseudomonadota bacterium]
MHRSHFVLRLALVSFALMACGPSQCCRSAEVERYEDAHVQSIARALDAHLIMRPLPEAWPEILAVCTEHGYHLDAPTPVENRTVESAPKPDEYGAYRMLVRVIRVDPTHWRVTFARQYTSLEADGGTPQITLEKDAPGGEGYAMLWTLVQRIEPVAAAEIAAAATQKAERAGATGRGLDRGCNACVELATPR